MAFMGEEMPHKQCPHQRVRHLDHPWVDEDARGNLDWFRCRGVNYIPKHRKETNG